MLKQSSRPLYTVIAKRDGRFWFLKVKERPDIFGQAQTWAEVEATARDLIALMLDVPSDSFDVDIHRVGGIPWSEIRRDVS